jgi:hypothetical protein
MDREREKNGCCEPGNEPLDFLQDWKFLDSLENINLPIDFCSMGLII